MNPKIIHECEFCYGKISDVTTRSSDNTIRCRRCGEVLKEEQIEINMLNKIKEKIYKY